MKEATNRNRSLDASNGRRDSLSNECRQFVQDLLGTAEAARRFEPSTNATERQELSEWLDEILIRDGIFTIHEGNWDPAKHPRRGTPPNAGWFAPTDGGGEGASLLASGPHAADPSRWYLPAEHKGTWSGAKGDSALRLKTPVSVEGTLIDEIDYKKGVPVLDKFAMPGGTVTVVLTGDNNIDIRNAKAAWQKLNPGRALPADSVFHHDLLHVAEETVILDGKKSKVLVGKMHLIPSDANRLVFHEGSASVARKFYQGIGTDLSSVKRLASEQASLAGKSGTVVARAATKIVPGKIAKSIGPFLGRNVVRAIPIVGTGLAILEFPDNVSAHGFVGAAARATPLLGDLISAHDLGSDLAKQITDEANAGMDAAYREINDRVAVAWKEATEQTVQAFHELASQIEVTNDAYGSERLVDPHEVAAALKSFRNQMQMANHVRATQGARFDFDATAARAKQELKQRLTEAAQKHAPRLRAPVY